MHLQHMAQNGMCSTSRVFALTQSSHLPGVKVRGEDGHRLCESEVTWRLCGVIGQGRCQVSERTLRRMKENSDQVYQEELGT